MTTAEWTALFFRCPVCQTAYPDDGSAYACVVSHPEAWGTTEDPFLYGIAEAADGHD